MEGEGKWKKKKRGERERISKSPSRALAPSLEKMAP